MNKISGIICEFNPLHEGHKYIISRAKEGSEGVVCIMSGAMVQRGECAVADKYDRAAAAIEAGANLVIELPFPWCAAPAEFFAAAGISLAVSAGVTTLVFGSESGDADVIRRAAELTESPEFLSEIDSLYRDNKGYAEARYEAAKMIAPDVAPVFDSRNDALATEYVKQAKRLGYKGDFRAVKRIPGISASELRRSIPGGEKLFEIERLLFCLDKHEKDTFDSESGIVNRLVRAAKESESGVEMLSFAATKKYTDARLRRAALFALTGTTKEDLSALPEFTVLLAADGVGREIVKGISDVEVVTKPASARCPQFVSSAAADRLRTLCFGRGTSPDEFMKKSPIIY